ncbi:DUF4142 domain-containing protein [Devosia salina]|uniref:DUF4142 domain-containing protein n=1 Tax=Devosia salina TaxID=2860336 RepID=A0ABX8WBD8_9HYPH|nr:DUF4142 domain-containing protein [Devosia salina]QYO76093.1 DUF4142 domain-containing protein [Devosia salina]
MIARTLMATVAILSLPAAAMAQTPSPQNQQTEQASAAATDPSMFTALAASGNLFEVETSQNALDRVQSADVRDFAQMMIEDHQKALDQLQQAAAEDGWDMPTEMGNVHRQKFETLSGQNADTFETDYVRAQVQAHNEAVSLYQDYLASGPAGALHTYAQKTLPVLQQHQQRIMEIAQAMGVAGDSEDRQAATIRPADSQQAQATAGDGRDAQQDPVALDGTCQTSLTNFANELGRNQYWLNGWGNRWGHGQETATTSNTTVMPWTGVAAGVRSPRTQIRELYGAAQVLAYQGNSEGCQYLLQVLENTYGTYTARLEDAGVEPGSVSDWRREQLAYARPVTELTEMGRLNVDDITGTDVRNLQDENLGSVSDLVIDPDSGQLTYVVVARGGFLGFGEDYVAVPWERFSATPGVNTLVLDLDPQRLEQAPSIDPDSFGDPSTYAAQDQQIEAFWNS